MVINYHGHQRGWDTVDEHDDSDEPVDEHDDSIMPEDCLVSEIEAGSCGYGIVGYHNP